MIRLGLTYKQPAEHSWLDDESQNTPKEDDSQKALPPAEPFAPPPEPFPPPPEPFPFPKEELMEEPIPEELSAAIEYWLARYPRNSSDAMRKIRALAEAQPDPVAETLVKLYYAGKWGDATPFLAVLLSGIPRVAAKLCNPALRLDDSLSLAKTAAQYDPRFDASFAKSLLEEESMPEAVRQRGLALLEKFGRGERLTPILIQFLRNPDSRVRSKAALMLGQTMPTEGIMNRLMGDQNARVRANFIEGLWDQTSRDFRPLFRLALHDADHRVVGNALVGLYQLGEVRYVVSVLERMSRLPAAKYRASAAWVMGQTADPQFLGLLRCMARDPDPLVCRNVSRAQQRIHVTRDDAH